MPTLVLPPRFTSDSHAVKGVALAAGWRVERLASWRVTEPLPDPVLYGEPLFVAVVAPQLGLAMLEPPLDWLAGVPFDLRRREVRFATLADARALTAPAFVKPADEKAFDAKVWSSGATLPARSALPDHLAVLIAEPVRWGLEVRHFVADRRVVARSAYLRAGELAQVEDGSRPASAAELDAATSIVERVLREVACPPAFTLDVGEVVGRGWAIVEANPCWGSGIYGCDPAGALAAARRASVLRAELSAEDARWVIARRGDQEP
jgi:hypothetical protein